MTFAEQFTRDIATHQMHVIRDDGVHRHIRFKRPDTMCMHFDLITWPGYLCYTGDMGTYVFQRLNDMFTFFRRGENRGHYRIDLRYWAEKLEASDRGDGVREWTAEKFKAEVRDRFEQDTSDEEEWPAERKAELWSEIEEQVCAAADDSEHHAWVALWELEHDGFRFQDWERDCKVWTHRFLWCCHALEWAIATYDAAKQPAPEGQA
jgi:hypothetical protein